MVSVKGMNRSDRMGDAGRDELGLERGDRYLKHLQNKVEFERSEWTLSLLRVLYFLEYFGRMQKRLISSCQRLKVSAFSVNSSLLWSPRCKRIPYL